MTQEQELKVHICVSSVPGVTKYPDEHTRKHNSKAEKNADVLL